MEHAAARGDFRRLDPLLADLLGLSAGAGVARADGPVRLARHLGYRGCKPAELALLEADAKRVVKFEDVPIAEADALSRRYGGGWRLTRSPAYRKDGLRLVSHAVLSNDPLVTVYASRGAEGEALRQVETHTPEDVIAAGTALEIPPCCIEAFAHDAARSRRGQDCINDDACRRVLASAVGPADWRLSPLSDWELLGFYPCSLRCHAALAAADRTLAALQRRHPASPQAAQEALQGSVIFWRIPFFLHLPGPVDPDGWLPLRGATINIMPHQPARAIQTRLQQLLNGVLHDAEAVRLTSGPSGTELLARAPGATRLVARTPPRDAAGFQVAPLRVTFCALPPSPARG